ncbi:MAG: ECF-type sigma factor [Bryobacteraceae bacterium]
MDGDVSVLLARVKNGDEAAREELVPLVYRELRRLAGHFLRQERVGHTLQPTALVHEAYLALVKQDVANWQNRAQFMAISAQLMRRILLQYARRRRAAKRVLPEGVGEAAGDGPLTEEILAVDEAIDKLAKLDEQRARMVELRYFGGMSVEETAEALGVSARTVNRDWALAKSFLQAELSGVRME